MGKPLSPERVNHWMQICQGLPLFKGLNPDDLHDLLLTGHEIRSPAGDSLASPEDAMASGHVCLGDGAVNQPPSTWLCLPGDALRQCLCSVTIPAGYCTGIS